MIMTRMWAMPTADTFDCPPIGEFVKKYLRQSKVSVDPFARNKRWATYTNDLNPDTAAEWHLEAREFILGLVARGIRADLVIFDPPYSVQQCKTAYAGFGVQFGQDEVTSAWGTWSKHKDAINDLLTPGGISLCFGWDSCGMGKERPFRIEEILMVCHGAGHNDTICIAERKMAHQMVMSL